MGPSQSDGCVIHKLDSSLSDKSLRKYTRLRTEAWQAIYHQDLLFAPMALKSFGARREELEQPDYHCWVCVTPNPLTGATDLDSGEWIGLINIRGPCSEAQYHNLNESSLKPQTEHFEMRWRPGGLYFRAMHREINLYKALNSATTTWLWQQATQAAEAAGLDTVLIRQRFNNPLNSVTRATNSIEKGLREIKQMTVVEKLEDDGWMNEVSLEELTEASRNEPAFVAFESCTLFRL